MTFFRHSFQGQDMEGKSLLVTFYGDVGAPCGLALGRTFNWLNPRFHYFMDGQQGARIEDVDIPNITFTDTPAAAVDDEAGATHSQNVELQEQWPAGTLVELHGLRAAPELNGQQGAVIGWTSERCHIRLGPTSPSGAVTKGVKPANLRAVAEYATARVQLR